MKCIVGDPRSDVHRIGHAEINGRTAICILADGLRAMTERMVYLVGELDAGRMTQDEFRIDEIDDEAETPGEDEPTGGMADLAEEREAQEGEEEPEVVREIKEMLDAGRRGRNIEGRPPRYSGEWPAKAPSGTRPVERIKTPAGWCPACGMRNVRNGSVGGRKFRRCFTCGHEMGRKAK